MRCWDKGVTICPIDVRNDPQELLIDVLFRNFSTLFLLIYKT